MIERSYIRRGDYILITNSRNDRYLQIGEIVEVQYYPHASCVELYRVQFADGICEYNDDLDYECKILMFGRY